MNFELSRKEGFPTHHDNQHTAANLDVILYGIICSIGIIAFSIFITLPAFKWKKKCTVFLYTSMALFVGGVIITSNYGHNWEVGKVKIISPYKAATAEEIKGELGIYVSLRGINITLQGKAKSPDGQLSQEEINYNENFSWEWAQGRFGFGNYAGRISRDFRAAVLRGVPLPILQLAEYFTFDGEGLRFGRYYRCAGWYCQLLLWAALPTWILTLIFFRTVVSKGAALMIITGVLQGIAIIIWTTLRNKLDVIVPFESEDGESEVMLKTKYGFDYYLVVVNSLLCIIGGGTIFTVNVRFPEFMCNCFGIDVQTLYTDVVVSSEELEAVSQEVNNHELRPMDLATLIKGHKRNSAVRCIEDPLTKEDLYTVRLKRGTTFKGQNFKRSQSQMIRSSKKAARRKRAHTEEVNINIQDSAI